MSESFEPVLVVEDYYDGPRIGVALFRGLPHRFRSLGWLRDGGWSDGFDSNDDRFYLSPTDTSLDSSEFLVRGKFRVRQPAPNLPPGVLRPLEVLWTSV